MMMLSEKSKTNSDVPNGRNCTSQSSGVISSTLKRRRFLKAYGTAVLLLGTGRSSAASINNQVAEPIYQPTTTSDKAFITRAFEMRDRATELGDQAYGAIVVLNDEIIGQSWSRVVLDQDPTAHAEISAIRDAARRLGNRNLAGATLFSSSRPCPMCEAAAYWAGIDSMIHGQGAKNAGAPKLCR